MVEVGGALLGGQRGAVVEAQVGDPRAQEVEGHVGDPPIGPTLEGDREREASVTFILGGLKPK